MSPPVKSELTNVTPKRPSSCYGNVFGNSEENEEKKNLQTRKLSFDSMQRNGFGNRSRSCNVIKANGVKIPGQSNNGEEETTVPTLTLIKTPDADQSAEDILALNAAAIIANIKLKTQLSKKKSSNGTSENDCAPSSQHLTEPAQDLQDGNTMSKSHSAAAAFVPLSKDIHWSSQTMSLQEALLMSRPDFISRSQRRARELERKTRERKRAKIHSAQPQITNCPGTAAKGNLFKSSDRSVTLRQQHSAKQPTEVKRRQEEEARREECFNNRQRSICLKRNFWIKFFKGAKTETPRLS
ncbi:hypothetical protein WMY93_010102 [Mugilogobius chulae]|uniref:ALMS motif domain-containing protein n=1 Tax=Mugilogobius chulae TaxID=88201 RepID=A0AAW0P6K5_9GOBI